MFPYTTNFSGNTPLAGHEYHATPNKAPPSSLKKFANFACNTFIASPFAAVALRSPAPIAAASVLVLSAAALTDLWKTSRKEN